MNPKKPRRNTNFHKCEGISKGVTFSIFKWQKQPVAKKMFRMIIAWITLTSVLEV